MVTSSDHTQCGKNSGRIVNNKSGNKINDKSLLSMCPAVTISTYRIGRTQDVSARDTECPPSVRPFSVHVSIFHSAVIVAHAFLWSVWVSWMTAGNLLEGLEGTSQKDYLCIFYVSVYTVILGPADGESQRAVGDFEQNSGLIPEQQVEQPLEVNAALQRTDW